MSRPSPEAIVVALGLLDSLAAEHGDERHADALEIVLSATQLPELAGVRAAAEIVGVESSNLHKQTWMPAPVYELPAGKFYDVERLREIAAERAAKDITGSEAVA